MIKLIPKCQTASGFKNMGEQIRKQISLGASPYKFKDENGQEREGYWFTDDADGKQTLAVQGKDGQWRGVSPQSDGTYKTVGDINFMGNQNLTGENGEELTVTPQGASWQNNNYRSAHDGSLSNFIETTNALTGGVMNRLSPTQNARLAYDTYQWAKGNKSWGDVANNMVFGNNGIVSNQFAKEHPYWSMAINGAGDILSFGGYKGFKTFKNSNLRYELDPRYQRFYHSSEVPFDIENFHTGTKNDAGLHVTSKPNTISGNYLYTGYMRKPSFRFIDVWSNGAEMFNPNFADDLGRFSSRAAGTSELDTQIWNKVFNGKAPFVQAGNTGGRQLNAKTASNGLLYNFSESHPNTKTVDLVEEIFPKESKQFKQGLKDLYNERLSLEKTPKDNYKFFSDADPEKVTQLNKKVSKYLSDHGYSVGVYSNANPHEMVGDAYSIFDHNAIRNTRLIKKNNK